MENLLGTSIQLPQGNSNLETILKTSALRDRTIHIFDTIDDELAIEVQHYINRIIHKDKTDYKKSPKKFTLLINSYGGSVLAGQIIIGAIHYAQSLGYEVTGICQGFAFSMAFDVLLACDKRYGYSFSEYMVHQTSTGARGALVQMDRNIEHSKKQWQKAVDFYVSRTKITREQLEDLYERDKDWFLLTEEALEYGVIHKILK